MLKYPVIDIIRGTTVDGPGFRTSIYLAGCSHNCPGCHNPESHNPNNFNYHLSLEDIMTIIKEEDFNVTLSGGDPLFFPHIIAPLVSAIKQDSRNLWIYTGFTWEEIIKNQLLLQSVIEADVVVDGKYIESLNSPDLPFRGSSNQRIIDVQESLRLNRPIKLIGYA